MIVRPMFAIFSFICFIYAVVVSMKTGSIMRTELQAMWIAYYFAFIAYYMTLNKP